jgi:transcriptional regulator with XRE-family HTH domain
MLVEKLEAKRKELNLSDADFARLLGISRPLWSATRSGNRAVSIALLRGVAQAFPEVDGDVLRYLRGENGDGAQSIEN